MSDLQIDAASLGGANTSSWVQYHGLHTTLELSHKRASGFIGILFLKQPDFFFCILERKKPVDVQALIAKAAVEGFNERIIRRFSGP